MDTIFVPPNTNCKECIFNEKAECRLNKIELYSEKGIEINHVDGNHVLHRFICPYFRTKDWLEEHKSCQNLVQEIKKENGFPYIPIVLFLEGDVLKYTLKKISNFSIKPKEIFIIVKNGGQVNKIINDVKSVLDDSEITWHVHVELEELSWHNIFKFYNRHEFLLLISALPSVQNKWPELIANKVQDELAKFSYAENRAQNMMLIPPYVYKAYYFEHGKNFIQKLRNERHKQKCIL